MGGTARGSKQGEPAVLEEAGRYSARGACEPSW